MLRALSYLLLFQLIGESLVYSLHLPLPGPVLGMALLLIALLLNRHLLQTMRGTALGLLQHLSLLFVPAGVGVMLHVNRLAEEGVAIVVSLVLSTVLGIAATALTAVWLGRWLNRKKAGHADT